MNLEQMLYLGMTVVKAFINTAAQLGNGSTVLSCSKRYQSHLRRCNQYWSSKRQMFYLAGFGNLKKEFLPRKIC